MKVEMIDVTVKELVEGYQDSEEEGVFGYAGQLDIRPPYQREFVYNDKQQQAVINTVMKGFPLNVMYWSKKDDGSYEIIDGQQRTLSICRYIDSVFSKEDKYFHNQPQDVREQILNYPLTIYVCEGTDSEKLDWFRTINIAGEKLTDQELRNAVYAGSWVTDAKRYFSKQRGPAYGLGASYMTGTPIRQDYLEKVLKWISEGKIEEYMARHQHDDTAEDLWMYFRDIIEWVESIFPKYYKEMEKVEWGLLYNKYKNRHYDAEVMKGRVKELMADEDVQAKKGIFPYLLDDSPKNIRHLNIRTFDKHTKRTVYEQQNGTCAKCGGRFKKDEMEADHIIPWSKGGKTVRENCQMLCKDCNREKSDK